MVCPAEHIVQRSVPKLLLPKPPTHLAITHSTTRPPLRTLHASAPTTLIVPRPFTSIQPKKRLDQSSNWEQQHPIKAGKHILAQHSMCRHEASSSLPHDALHTQPCRPMRPCSEDMLQKGTAATAPSRMPHENSRHVHRKWSASTEMHNVSAPIQHRS
jgi:hypothetical protein